MYSLHTWQAAQAGYRKHIFTKEVTLQDQILDNFLERKQVSKQFKLKRN